MIESAVQIEARAGDEVELRLDRQGVGGYLWTLIALPTGISIVGEPTQESGGAIGSGAELVYRTRCEDPGRFEAVFELRRPWGERDLAERRTFAIMVAPV